MTLTSVPLTWTFQQEVARAHSGYVEVASVLTEAEREQLCALIRQLHSDKMIKKFDKKDEESGKMGNFNI